MLRKIAIPFCVRAVCRRTFHVSNARNRLSRRAMGAEESGGDCGRAGGGVREGHRRAFGRTRE